MIDDIRPQRPKAERVPVEVSPRPHIEATKRAPAKPVRDPVEPFLTPEEAAARDDSRDSSGAPTMDIPKQEPPRSKWQQLKQWRPTKKQGIIIGAVALIVIGGGVAFALTRPSPKPVPLAVRQSAPVLKAKPPAPIVSKLTGLPISDASINDRPVTGVMIENSLDARPQSGLDEAGVVFEAVAEAGITRFLALYQDTQPSYMGPVRSARPYFIQWDMGFDAAYAHVGGSPDALNDINAWGTKDLNQFYNASGYERISSRYAPHNVYTSAAQLNSLESQHGFNSSDFTGWPRKTDSPSKTPNASSIDINPSSYYYNTHYDYDPNTNAYKRSEGGQPHMEVDASGHQTQITPKVVIAMVISQTFGPLDASGAYYTNYAVVGSGQAYIFQDGTVTTGTWNKSDLKSQITFTDASNKPIKLNAGQTWITAVGASSDVSYK